MLELNLVTFIAKAIKVKRLDRYLKGLVQTT